EERPRHRGPDARRHGLAALRHRDRQAQALPHLPLALLPLPQPALRRDRRAGAAARGDLLPQRLPVALLPARALARVRPPAPLPLLRPLREPRDLEPVVGRPAVLAAGDPRAGREGLDQAHLRLRALRAPRDAGLPRRPPLRLDVQALAALLDED